MQHRFHPNFTYINDVVPDAVLDIRYASWYNVTGRPLAGYHASCPCLVTPAAEALARAASTARKSGVRFWVFDAYRPTTAVADLLSWCQDPADEGLKEFYPTLRKEELFPLGYFSKRSAHSRGSAIDLTLASKDGTPLDMGGMFDFFDDISHRDALGLTDEQRANRKLLAEIMEAEGFGGISTEWWHFRYLDEPFPDTYFDFPVE